jgi:hypothetical protein
VQWPECGLSCCRLTAGSLCRSAVPSGFFDLLGRRCCGAVSCILEFLASAVAASDGRCCGCCRIGLMAGSSSRFD